MRSARSESTVGPYSRSRWSSSVMSVPRPRSPPCSVPSRLCADEITRPSTSAANVTSKVITTRIESTDSRLRCCSRRKRCADRPPQKLPTSSNKASSAAPSSYTRDPPVRLGQSSRADRSAIRMARHRQYAAPCVRKDARPGKFACRQDRDCRVPAGDQADEPFPLADGAPRDNPSPSETTPSGGTHPKCASSFCRIGC